MLSDGAPLYVQPIATTFLPCRAERHATSGKQDHPVITNGGLRVHRALRESTPEYVRQCLPLLCKRQ